MAQTERLHIEYNVINTDITVLIGLYSRRGNRLVLWPDLNAHPDGEGQCEQDQQEGEQDQDPAAHPEAVVVVV